MNWLRKWMSGRYGGDQLSLFLLGISVLISMVAYFIPIPYISYLSYVPLIFALFRMLSKNVSKRQRENDQFIHFFDPIKSIFKKSKRKIRDKEHRYYTCTSCKTTLRVPVGKGKITITCPKCKNKFIKNT